MANFAFNPKWELGIRQLETSDPVVAGPDGVDNIAPRQLSHRTDFIKEFLDTQFGVIDNPDGSLKNNVVLPVSKGGTGLNSIANGFFLRGNNAGGYSAVSAKDIIDQLKLLAFYDTAPLTNVNPVIYVVGKGMMEWQQFGAWSGYARLDCGAFVPDTSAMPRSMTIDAIGGTFNKTLYPALWAWAQANGHVVGAASWKEGLYKFVDLGGSSFKVPDLRNQFIRMTGVDADNANARLLGSSQLDAIQNITGSFEIRRTSQSASASSRTVDFSLGAFEYSSDVQGAGYNNIEQNLSGLKGNDKLVFNASRVVRTSTETRTANTAFAPRIVGF